MHELMVVHALLYQCTYTFSILRMALRLRVSYNGTCMFAVFLLTEQMLEIGEKDP